jgi:hypothetical protein
LGFDFGFCIEHDFNPRESWMLTLAIYRAPEQAPLHHG